ncbi:glucuronate isomerase [Akkermansiaceae bacterium]|nr:glucuronate isomerase [Akkermansiaceae bacterium]MDB4725310.1 glucuronate isomerase [Akkermansiaceae bacterium]
MTRTYLDDNFLLLSKTAERLFNESAKDQQIIDYHTHLPPDEIANDQRWENVTELWLGHDHYKWRAMRANGIPESHITGDASPREKFQAWAETIPNTLRNPLYDWTHLELRRCFGINTLLSADTAEEIWNQANERLQDADFSARELMRRFRVDAVGTTDDPNDDLYHHEVANASDCPTKTYPTFRPDKALFVDRPALLNPWLDQLSTRIETLSDLLSALRARHDFFHEKGCRMTDHGMRYALANPCTEEEANRIFKDARNGNPANPVDTDAFGALIMFHIGQWNAERDWTMQLHLGPKRSPNSRMFAQLGPDAGFDTIGDWPQGEALLTFLDSLAAIDKLPKTIVYNLNPRDNAVLAAACGSFQEAPIRAKVQFGSGWWFNDTIKGMEDQINILSSVGLLSHFVGMLTDSRSFLSFPRHEYFRRILCNVIGQDVEDGKLPDDHKLLNHLVGNICYHNAHAYFGLPHHKKGLLA